MKDLLSPSPLHHESPLPSSPSSAIAHLHNHVHYLSSTPHMAKHELLPTPTPPPSLPPPNDPATPNAEWTFFRVTDVVPTLPAGLWDSEVVSTYEFCKTTKGMFLRVRSPLGIVVESTWAVDGGGMVREDTVIRASRFLAGILRAQCERNWRGIHQRMLAPLYEGKEALGGR